MMIDEIEKLLTITLVFLFRRFTVGGVLPRRLLWNDLHRRGLLKVYRVTESTKEDIADYNRIFKV